MSGTIRSELAAEWSQVPSYLHPSFVVLAVALGLLLAGGLMVSVANVRYAFTERADDLYGLFGNGGLAVVYVGLLALVLAIAVTLVTTLVVYW